MFTVTITKKTIEERPAGKDWELTGLDDPKYAYTPEIVKKKEVEEKIYEQTVEAIDIVSVIEAVNKPGKCMASPAKSLDFEQMG